MMNRSALFGASTKPHAGDETQILKNESSCWGTTCFDTTNQQNMISPPTHMATTGMTVVNDPWDEVTHQKLIDANGDYTQNLALFINSSGPKIKKGLHAQLGRHLYVIQHKIASGGFAHIHLAQRDDGKKIVIKEENGGSLWEAHMLNVTRRRFNKNEKLSSCVNYVDKTLTLIDYYPNGSLLDWMNSCRLEALSIDKRVVALDMMKMINSLHQIAVIHGDVKPDNFMVVGQYNTSRGDRVPVMKLIDFGRAIDMNAYQKNTVFIARSKTSCYECPQMIEGLPWNIHIDLFAIAASIYPLAFSSLLKPIKHEESGKWGVPQRRLGEIWEVFYDELLNFTTPTNNFVPSFRDSPLPKLIELFQGAKH